MEAIREREAQEKQEKADREKRTKKKEKASEIYWIGKEIEHEQYLLDEMVRKNKQMYDFEKRERDRLARPPYVDKRELTGAEAGEIALQRQKETEILNEKKSKREKEETELWRQLERERMGKLTEDNQITQSETEQHTKEFTEAVSFEKKKETNLHELYGLQKKSLKDTFKGQEY